LTELTVGMLSENTSGWLQLNYGLEMRGTVGSS